MFTKQKIKTRFKKNTKLKDKIKYFYNKFTKK